MSESWRNNSAPGFVYFQNEDDNPDFLSFNDSPPSRESPKHFSPSNYSSPNPKYKNSPKYKGSPRNFNLRNTYRHSGGNFGNRNNSFESNPRANNFYRGNKNHRGRGFHHNFSGRDISLFIDKDCLTDPWKPLEQFLKSQEKVVTVSNDTSNNSEDIKKLSSEGSSSGGSESSSSGEEEEEEENV